MKKLHMKTLLVQSAAFVMLALPVDGMTQAKAQTPRQINSEVTSSKAIWAHEPTSFAGLSLVEPIVLENCPVEEKRFNTMSFYMTDYSEISRRTEAQEGVGCVEADLNAPRSDVRTPPKENLWGSGTGYFRVALFRRLKPLGDIVRLQVRDGRIERIEVSFSTGDYDKVKSILVERYGSAQRTEAVELRTNGGVAFPGEALYWLGEKVSLDARSMVKREFNEITKTLQVSGALVIVNNEWVRMKSEAEKSNVKSAAEKL